MARNILSTRLNRISQLTPTIIELDIKMSDPKELKFKAGQFMMLNIPPREGQKRPTLRAYSIASDANEASGFKLIVKLVPNGLGSDFLKNLKPGDNINFTGPFGKLLFLEPPTKQVLLISTGAGISQHTSYLFTHAEKYPQVKFRMLVGVWNEQETFYKEELFALKNRLKNFDYQFVVDSPTPAWTGLKGFVTSHIDMFDYKNNDTTFYLCGNPAMINAVTEKLKADGFDPARILAEAFS